MSTYFIESFAVGAFQCNCSLLIHQETKKCLVIDPGDESDVIWEKVKDYGVEVVGLWHTHAHIDHIGGTQALLDQCHEAYDRILPVYLHEGDKWLYENVTIQAHFLRLPAFDVPAVFERIVEGQKYEGFPGARALHTPGHTPGSCCLFAKDGGEIEIPRSAQSGLPREAPHILFSGDTLFRRSIGRTDLWGGDSAAITKNIRSKLFTLDPSTVVIPGHGPLTRIQEEREKNPFVGADAM